MKVPTAAILASMDVTSQEGIHTVCKAYVTSYSYVNEPPTRLLKQALRLILQENLFQFAGTWYSHGYKKGSCLC